MKPTRFFCYFLWAQSCPVQILFLLLFSLQLSKLTVPVLKEFVKQAGIKCGTKKADLVEAITDHFGVWFLCILKNIIDFILKNIFSLLNCCSGQSQATIPAWGWEVVSTCRLEREVWDSWMDYYNKTYLAVWHFRSLKTTFGMCMYYTLYQNRISFKNAEIR